MTNPSIRYVRFVILVALMVVLCAAPAAQAQSFGRSRSVVPTDSREFRAAFRDVVAEAARSTVRVLCDNKDVALGAVVGADGWILTKASQMRGKIVIQLRDGREFPARVVGRKDDYDLAMLKIDAKGLMPVRWRESKADPVGNWVATPGMDDVPVATGVMSVAARKITGRELGRRSTSGGYLGIAIAPAKNGVKVARVTKNSAAEKAGFEVDDLILKVAGEPIDNEDALFKALEQTRPKEDVVIRVLRDGKELELKPTLGKWPIGREDRMNELGSDLSHRRSGFPVIFQHDTVLAPSDCGGPIVDLDGKVIGINIARAGRTETYAIPSEAVQPLLDDLKSGKLAPKK
jgi:serine protease Do